MHGFCVSTTRRAACDQAQVFWSNLAVNNGQATESSFTTYFVYFCSEILKDSFWDNEQVVGVNLCWYFIHPNLILKHSDGICQPKSYTFPFCQNKAMLNSEVSYSLPEGDIVWSSGPVNAYFSFLERYVFWTGNARFVDTRQKNQFYPKYLCGDIPPQV